MVKKLLCLAVCGVLLMGLAACQLPSEPPELEITQSIEDTYQGNISIEEIQVEGDTLLVSWRNNTPYTVRLGASYVVQIRDSEDNWVSCSVSDDPVFHTVAQSFSPGDAWVQTYEMAGHFDISQPGEYRFQTNTYLNLTKNDTMEIGHAFPFTVEESQ